MSKYKIAVCGCGLLGSKIIGSLIYYGHHVVIYDLNHHVLNHFHEMLAQEQSNLLSKGLISNNTFLGTYETEPDLEKAIQDVDFVLEAIPESMTEKRAFFQRVSNACPQNTILMTSTIELKPEDIFEFTACKERTLGLRFLYPVYFVEDVEITTYEETSSGTIEKVKDLVYSMKKNIFQRTSGASPLILSKEQIDAMEQARREEMRRTDGNQTSFGFSSTQAEAGSNVTYHVHGGAVSQFHRGPSYNQTPPHSLQSNGDAETCPRCKEAPTKCILTPCQHQACRNCSKSMVDRKECCPMAGCFHIIKSYHSIGGTV